MLYTIEVQTGTVSKAGTDANVYIRIYGAEGATGDIHLDNSGENNFEKGQLDTFKREDRDVGELIKITIRHDNHGVGPGWYLAWVKVNGILFPANRWLATDEPPYSLSADLDRE